MKYMFFLLFLFVGSAAASTSLDCSQPKNINECERSAFAKTEAEYVDFLQRAKIKLSKKTDQQYLARFNEIESQWQNLARAQCQHLREFYKEGSLGAASFISCYGTMYKNRIEELEVIYDDLLGER